ncbi:MAG: tripartite tricarboxylate transporter permease [Candidatus Diapherotrites archaeon]
MIEILMWGLLGCVAGIFSGITPGIHVNTLAFLVLLLVTDAPAGLISFIVAMAITHSFYDFIPSIVLGVPDESNYLSLLPGHRYLVKGLAYRAIMLTAIGGLFGTIILIIFLPLFMFFLYRVGNFLPLAIPWLLIAVLLLVVLSAKNKIKTLLVVLLSAALGTILLNKMSLENGVMAIVIGAFSISGLTISLINDIKLRKQKLFLGDIELGNVMRGSLLAFLGSSIVAMLPSMGPNHAAFILRKIFKNIGTEVYMIMIGGINTCNLILSLFVLYSIGKTRTGIALAIREIINKDPQTLFLFIGITLISASFSIFTIAHFSSVILKSLQKVSYKKISTVILIGLLIFVLFFCGPIGLIATLTASSIGIYAITNRVPRSASMAFLIVPTIVIYLCL